MDVKVIEHVRELPGEKLRGYMLAKDYTEKEAARDYKAVYGHEPVRGWKWANYLYLQLPEKSNEVPAPSSNNSSMVAESRTVRINCATVLELPGTALNGHSIAVPLQKG